MKFLSFVIPFALLCSCKAQTPKLESSKDDNTLLWEISGNKLDKPTYLFGTFHLMCKNDILISNNLKAAIKACDEVYFEMDLDDASSILGALLFMNMKDGKQLKDLYTAEEYSRLENFFSDSLKTPIGMMQRMKPLFLQSLLYPKMLACKQFTGVEEELMKVAKENKKEIKGLETIQFQASIFDSIPYEAQAKTLLNSIDSIADYTKEFNEMLAIYKTQKLKEIEDLFLKSEFGEMENQDILLDNRNRNWVGQLKNLMPAKSLFVAVGAGHLVGKNGVIELLRKEGYIVRPLNNK